MEEIRKEDDHVDDGLMRLKKGSEDDGNKKLVYIGQRREGIEDVCIGSQGPQWTVVLENKKKKK
jgi:hypothetical protein